MRQFLEAIHGTNDFQLTGLHETTRPMRRYGSLETLLPLIEKWNENGYNIFTCMGTIPDGNTSDANVTSCSAFYIDQDDLATMPDEVRDSASITSGRSETRWHAMWLVDGGVDPETFRAIQLALISKFGTDVRVQNPARLMRVPGTINWKPEAEGAIHELWSINTERTYTVEAFCELFDIEPTIPKPVESAGIVARPKNELERHVANLEAKFVEEGGRQGAILAWTRDAVAMGMDVDVVQEHARVHLLRWGYSEAKAAKDSVSVTEKLLEKIETGVVVTHKTNSQMFDEAEESEPEEHVQTDFLELVENSESKKFLIDNIERMSELDGDEMDILVDFVVNQKRWMSKKGLMARHSKKVGPVEVEISDNSFPKGDWVGPARLLIANRDKIIYFKRDFYTFDGTKYIHHREVDHMRRIINSFMMNLTTINASTGDVGPFPVSISAEAEVRNQLAFLTALPDRDRLNVWLGEGGDDIDEIEAGTHDWLNFKNGMLHLNTMEIKEHSSDWFSTTSLPFEYVPSASCPVWEQCLIDWFDGDQERVLLLQQWFGYMLTPRTNLQKMLILNGRSRGGKGTILKVLDMLLGGLDNVCSPSLSDFADHFGIEQMLGKSGIFIRDAHLISSKSSEKIVDSIKGIVGNDPQAVKVKFKNTEQVILSGKIIMATNVMHDFPDPSGALRIRMCVIDFKNSFKGRENNNLESELRGEIAGICNWALRGSRGLSKFVIPAMSVETLDEWETSSTPIKAWVRSECKVGEDESCCTDALYQSYQNWAKANNTYVMSNGAFIKNLKAAEPQIQKVHASSGGERSYKYVGISTEVIDDEFE